MRAGAVMLGRVVAVRRGPSMWAGWGRPAGPGGRGDVDRMPGGQVWRVATGRGAIKRSERMSGRRHGDVRTGIGRGAEPSGCGGSQQSRGGVLRGS